MTHSLSKPSRHFAFAILWVATVVLLLPLAGCSGNAESSNLQKQRERYRESQPLKSVANLETEPNTLFNGLSQTNDVKLDVDVLVDAKSHLRQESSTNLDVMVDAMDFQAASPADEKFQDLSSEARIDAVDWQTLPSRAGSDF